MYISIWCVLDSLPFERDCSACLMGGINEERMGLTEQQIPKPNATEGLSMTWPMQPTDMEKLKSYFEEVKAKM